MQMTIPDDVKVEIEPAVRLAENADAIRAHNERIEKHGTLLKPVWLEE